MNSYFVTLKPLTPYFFGGEKTFGQDKEDVSYYARSNEIPQQTTLLGMIRHQLLIQNKQDYPNKDIDWPKLIGSKSFNLAVRNDDPIHLDYSFGCIKQISPLFITNGQEENYVPNGLDYGKYKNKNGGKFISSSFHVDFEDKVRCNQNDEANPLPLLFYSNTLIPFDPKFGLIPLWVSSKGTLRQFEYESNWKVTPGLNYGNGFATRQFQTGIHRTLNKRKGQSDEGDYYQQESWKLLDDYQFGFYLDLDQLNNLIFKSAIINMGAERSVFQMTVQEVSDLPENMSSFDTLFAELDARNHRTAPAIVLQSDAVLESSDLKRIQYIIGDTIPFRYLSTDNDKTNYASINGVNSAINKGKEVYSLLKRGSVIYLKDNNNLDFLKNAYLHKIGLNHYKYLVPIKN